MTVAKLYERLEELLPRSLSCEWDNDGLMCCPDPDAEVKRVLFTLDVTAQAVDYAVAGGFDLILSHHPMIFRPLTGITDPRFIKLIQNGVSVMSFHTRLDAKEGGVNHVLAELLGLEDVVRLGEGGVGVVGNLPRAMKPDAFAALVKRALKSPKLEVVLTDRPCQRVAVVGGDGKDFLGDAAAIGADTYLTGELKHNYLADAPELGINLLAGGHFHTENLICQRIREMLLEIDPSLVVDVISSNAVRVL